MTASCGAPGWVESLRTEKGYRAVTLGLDVVAGLGSVGLALWWTPGPVAERGIAAWTWVFVPVLMGVLAVRGMYRRRLDPGFLDDFEPVETAVAVSTLVTLTVLLQAVPRLARGAAVPEYVRPSDVVVRLWLAAAIVVPAVRLIRSVVQRYLRRRFRFGKPVLIVGGGLVTASLIARLQQVPDYGLRPVGVLDSVPPTDGNVLGVPYLGTTADLEEAVRITRAEKLVIGPSPVPDEELVVVAQRALSLGLRVRVVPRLMDVVGRAAMVEHIGGIPLMTLHFTDPRSGSFAIKHAVDRVMATVALAVLSPLFLALLGLVKLSSHGPAFFAQERMGRDGKVFRCLKFRTMRPMARVDDGFELALGSAPGGVEGLDRRTPIGKFMRKTSLDELPQLLNVLRGEMSLIGPRPERPEFVEVFEMQVRRYGQRHRVKAGMTGWAQVHGLRGQTSIADRAEFDNFYIENWSLSLDVKILALTALTLLRPSEEG